MAPELVADPAHVGSAADVYSLGVVLWELATRAPPHGGLGPSHILSGLMGGTLVLPSPPWVEPAWRGLVEDCMEVVPAGRSTAAAVAARLERLLEEEG